MSDTHSTRHTGNGLRLPLVESFYSIQGEGYNTGRAAWFIRLGGCDVICLSPKKHCPPQSQVLRAADELKAVISGEDDFEWAEKCRAEAKDGCLPFLQAEWTHRDRVMPVIIDYVKRHPMWRISLQTHKFMNIP